MLLNKYYTINRFNNRRNTSIGTDELEEMNQSEDEIENNLDSGEVSKESSRPRSSASVLTPGLNPILSHGARKTAATGKIQFSKSTRNSKKEKSNNDIVDLIRERSVERNEIKKMSKQTRFRRLIFPKYRSFGKIFKARSNQRSQVENLAPGI